MITDAAIRVIEFFSRVYVWLLLLWAPVGEWFYYKFNPEGQNDN